MHRKCGRREFFAAGACVVIAAASSSSGGVEPSGESLYTEYDNAVIKDASDEFDLSEWQDTPSYCNYSLDSTGKLVAGPWLKMTPQEWYDVCHRATKGKPAS